MCIDPDESLIYCNILHTMPYKVKEEIKEIWKPLMRASFSQLTNNITESRPIDFYSTFANALLQEHEANGSLQLHDIVYRHQSDSNLLETLTNWFGVAFDKSLIHDIDKKELLTLISRLYRYPPPYNTLEANSTMTEQSYS